jgi:hypothetical protein
MSPALYRSITLGTKRVARPWSEKELRTELAAAERSGREPIGGLVVRSG